MTLGTYLPGVNLCPENAENLRSGVAMIKFRKGIPIMAGYIYLIALILLIWHSAALIGLLLVGKILFFSPIGIFRILTKPGQTFKSAGSGLRKVMHHLTWAICSGLVIAFFMA